MISVSDFQPLPSLHKNVTPFHGVIEPPMSIELNMPFRGNGVERNPLSNVVANEMAGPHGSRKNLDKEPKSLKKELVSSSSSHSRFIDTSSYSNTSMEVDLYNQYGGIHQASSRRESALNFSSSSDLDKHSSSTFIPSSAFVASPSSSFISDSRTPSKTRGKQHHLLHSSASYMQAASSSGMVSELAAASASNTTKQQLLIGSMEQLNESRISNVSLNRVQPVQNNQSVVGFSSLFPSVFEPSSNNSSMMIASNTPSMNGSGFGLKTATPFQTQSTHQSTSSVLGSQTRSAPSTTGSIQTLLDKLAKYAHIPTQPAAPIADAAVPPTAPVLSPPVAVVPVVASTVAHSLTMAPSVVPSITPAPAVLSTNLETAPTQSLALMSPPIDRSSVPSQSTRPPSTARTEQRPSREIANTPLTAESIRSVGSLDFHLSPFTATFKSSLDEDEQDAVTPAVSPAAAGLDASPLQQVASMVMATVPTTDKKTLTSSQVISRRVEAMNAELEAQVVALGDQKSSLELQVESLKTENATLSKQLIDTIHKLGDQKRLEEENTMKSIEFIQLLEKKLSTVEAYASSEKKSMQGKIHELESLLNHEKNSFEETIANLESSHARALSELQTSLKAEAEDARNKLLSEHASAMEDVERRFFELKEEHAREVHKQKLEDDARLFRAETASQEALAKAKFEYELKLEKQRRESASKVSEAKNQSDAALAQIRAEMERQSVASKGLVDRSGYLPSPTSGV
jgi:hypothetical protein